MADNTVEKIFIAARSGDDKGLKILVEMFYKSLEITSDEEIALSWFCRSANLGEAEALCCLGRYSLRNREYDKAEKWLLQAREQGCSEAGQYLDELYSARAEETLEK
ncbi:MAG: sel1 repeat family protein [Desulfovibrio sp.]|nr:sel1 repeat family protein [Desulfovibrio sp.]